MLGNVGNFIKQTWPWKSENRNEFRDCDDRPNNFESPSAFLSKIVHRKFRFTLKSIRYVQFPTIFMYLRGVDRLWFLGASETKHEIIGKGK